MAAIILGKNLLLEEELIDFAFSDENVKNQNLAELKSSARDAALVSSLMLIRLMRVERIFVNTLKDSKNETK